MDLLGRDDELRSLHAFLDRPAAVGRAALVLEGEAGMGKSTLCGRGEASACRSTNARPAIGQGWSQIKGTQWGQMRGTHSYRRGEWPRTSAATVVTSVFSSSIAPPISAASVTISLATGACRPLDFRSPPIDKRGNDRQLFRPSGRYERPDCRSRIYDELPPRRKTHYRSVWVETLSEDPAVVVEVALYGLQSAARALACCR